MHTLRTLHIEMEKVIEKNMKHAFIYLPSCFSLPMLKLRQIRIRDIIERKYLDVLYGSSIVDHPSH